MNVRTWLTNPILNRLYVRLTFISFSHEFGFLVYRAKNIEMIDSKLVFQSYMRQARS
jgi:hypothetical protein